MKRGQKRRRGLGDQGKATQPGPWVGVFGTEATPLTQDADRLLVSLLPSEGGRASQRPAAPPQLPPDEPVEDAEAQEGQAVVTHSMTHSAPRCAGLGRHSWLNSAAAAAASGPDGGDSGGAREDPRSGGGGGARG